MTALLQRMRRRVFRKGQFLSKCVEINFSIALNFWNQVAFSVFQFIFIDTSWWRPISFSLLFIMGCSNIRMHSDQASESAILLIILKQTLLIGDVSHKKKTKKKGFLGLEEMGWGGKSCFYLVNWQRKTSGWLSIYIAREGRDKTFQDFHLSCFSVLEFLKSSGIITAFCCNRKHHLLKHSVSNITSLQR